MLAINMVGTKAAAHDGVVWRRDTVAFYCRKRMLPPAWSLCMYAEAIERWCEEARKELTRFYGAQLKTWAVRLAGVR